MDQNTLLSVLAISFPCVAGIAEMRWPKSVFAGVLFWISMVVTLGCVTGLLYLNWPSKLTEIPSGLIIVIGLSIAAFGVALQYHRGAVPVVSESLTRKTAPPAVVKKKYTAYDLESRIKATDALSRLIVDKLRPLQVEAQLIATELDQRIDAGTIVGDLYLLNKRMNDSIKTWNGTLSAYLTKYSEIDEHLNSPWNAFQIAGAAEELRREVVRIQTEKPNDVRGYLFNNKFPAKFQEVINTFYDWLGQREGILNRLRKEYESAEVHGGQ